LKGVVINFLKLHPDDVSLLGIAPIGYHNDAIVHAA
jgi:hypothetical protein